MLVQRGASTTLFLSSEQGVYKILVYPFPVIYNHIFSVKIVGLKNEYFLRKTDLLIVRILA